MKTEKQDQILVCMSDVLNQNGFRSEVMRKEDVPTLLRCESARQGKVGMDVIVELCFIPMKLPSEEEGLMQFFVTLFENAPESNAPMLRRACTYCNDFCALGAFGLFEGTGQIYLKYNVLIDGSLSLNQNITLLADNISLLIATAARFIDGFAAVGFSGTPLEAVIAQELFPEIG